MGKQCFVWTNISETLPLIQFYETSCNAEMGGGQRKWLQLSVPCKTCADPFFCLCISEMAIIRKDALTFKKCFECSR